MVTGSKKVDTISYYYTTTKKKPCFITELFFSAVLKITTIRDLIVNTALLGLATICKPIEAV